jgi:hypothetical protein
VILDVHREVALASAKRNPFRHGPAGERTAPLEPEVVVKAPRRVSLNDETRPQPFSLRLPEGLGSLAGLPPTAVLVEAHLWIVA